MPTSDLSTLSALNKEDLQRLLRHLATDGFLASSLELSKQTGLKEYKLRSLKHWATRSGLIMQNALTPVGRLVVTKDPYLETNVTDWLIHFHLSLGDHTWQKLSENMADWDVWSYIVYYFLPSHKIFSFDDLLNAITVTFTNLSQEKLKKIIRLVLQTYTDSKAITNCKFLFKQQDRFTTGNANLSNPYTIGYLLARIWERDFSSKNSVLVDDVFATPFGLANVLGINESQLRQQLDVLATHEIIEQRSAKPHLTGKKTQKKQDTESSYQVIRCWNNAQELLEQAYGNDTATPNQPLIRSLASILDDDDEMPEFTKFLEWASGLIVLDGGSGNIITRLVS
jgi:Protein of unknown function (DUF4007)